MQQTSYKNYLLVVLTIIALFNYVDRIALGIMLEDIKRDLDLTDTQLGFLSGMAFALFYSVMGIPIARWADRGDRVMIISLTTALWSSAVALCGMVGNFVQLLAIRVGVAVGEAGCLPPALSLLADNFSRAERPRAVAIYGLAGALAYVVGFFGGGWLNELYGWRSTFMMLAVPGLVLAFVARFTLREPRRVSAALSRQLTTAASSGPAPPSLPYVFRTLWANATFRQLLLSMCINYFVGYGILQWQAVFFIRAFDFTSGELGTWLALTYGLGGLIGTYWGGEWSTRRAGGDERRQLRMMSFMLTVAAFLSASVYLVGNQYLGFALLGLCVVSTAATNAPMMATIQTLTPTHMRAVAFALVYLAANLIGMGLGPMAAGVLSDALRPQFGENSLRFALVLLHPGILLSAWYAWGASRSVTRDLAAVQADGHERYGGAVEKAS